MSRHAAVPVFLVGVQAGLAGDADRAIVHAHRVMAALHGAVREGDLGLLDQPGAQQHAIARHADDVALEAAEIGEEDFDRLPLALGPAFRNPLVPGRDFVARSRAKVIGRRRRVRPGSDQIDPPVRRRGGQLGASRDLVDPAGLARDLAAIAEREGHLRFRHDRRAHQRLPAAERNHERAEIIRCIEFGFMPAQHLVDGEGACRQPTPRAVGQRRLA